MALPKQVEEAATAAEEYMEGLAEANKEPVDTDEANDSEPDTQEDTEVAPEAKDESDNFEAKYSTLKGKYDAEVPRLHEELRDLKESVFDRLDKLSEKQQEPENDTPEEEEINPLLDAFREEYGDDLMKYLDAYFDSKLPNVKEELSQAVKPVEEKVASIEESQVNVAQAEFATYLDEHVDGEWLKVWESDDPKFTEFLAKPDPSGLYTYGDLADLYSKNWDVDKMAKLFNVFFEKPESSKKEEKSKSDKDLLVAPSKKSPATTPDTDDGKINWTTASIKQFEIDDRKGQYSPEESKKMWDDLLSAPSEGRIH